MTELSKLQKFENIFINSQISLTENTLPNSLLGMENCNDEQQQSSWLVLHTLLQECIRTGSQEYLNYLTLLNHLAHKAMEHKDLNGFKNIGSFGIKKTFGSLTMFLVTAWSEFFDDYSSEGETQNISLRLDLVSCARKELNYRQCKRGKNHFHNNFQKLQNFYYKTLCRTRKTLQEGRIRRPRGLSSRERFAGSRQRFPDVTANRRKSQSLD